MRVLGDFDFVIVGGGSAGCILANRLSADPDKTVALIEAGGEDTYFWIHVPIGYLYTMNNPQTDWCFQTAEEPGLNGRSLAYPRGKGLGGCSLINGMIYMRGQSHDYDHWRQLGNAGWGWDDVLPHFLRGEDFFGAADELHATGGEWRIEYPRIAWPLLDAFRDAALEVGIPKIDDFNRGNNEGSAYFHVNQRSGRRWNAAQAFVHPIRKRPNLTVFTHAKAHRIHLAGRRARGVEARLQDGMARLNARHEVLLAAGAVGSPHLLQLSGVGPGSVLRDLEIPVLHELVGVGNNLQDHLQLRLIYKVSGIETLNERANRWLGKIGMGLEYLLLRRGPMPMAPSQVGVFARSDPGRETPNLQYHVSRCRSTSSASPCMRFPPSPRRYATCGPNRGALSPPSIRIPRPSRGSNPTTCRRPPMRKLRSTRSASRDRSVQAARLPPMRRASSYQGQTLRPMPSSPRRQVTSAPRYSTPWARRRWDTTPGRSSTIGSACMAFRDSGSLTHR